MVIKNNNLFLNMKLKIEFKFDKKIKKNDYSSKYFISTKQILNEYKMKNVSMLRFKHFEDDVVVAGIDECIQLLKFSLPKKIFNKTKIFYFEDGTITNKNQPILILEGNYQDFCFLENVIDSILSRRSSIATNCKKIIDLVGSENVIFMADRSDDYKLQEYDGYSAYIGGIKKFVTKQQVFLLNSVNDYQVLGTIPHALIQQFNGNLYEALVCYKNVFQKSPVVGLIDFNNNCLEEIQKLKDKNFKNLDFVRIDTSKSLIDECLKIEYEKTKNKELFGVNHKLITLVRQKLDECGYKNTKIIVSSGLTYNQIVNFKKQNTPIDIFGIGKSLLNINLNYTGDLITLNNRFFAKKGRDEDISKYLKNMKKIN